MSKFQVGGSRGSFELGRGRGESHRFRFLSNLEHVTFIVLCKRWATHVILCFDAFLQRSAGESFAENCGKFVVVEHSPNVR